MEWYHRPSGWRDGMTMAHAVWAEPMELHRAGRLNRRPHFLCGSVGRWSRKWTSAGAEPEALCGACEYKIAARVRRAARRGRG